MNRGKKVAIWVLTIGLSLCAALFALGAIALPQQVTWDDGHGDVYRGHILRGQWVGEVRIDYRDGAVYEGPLKNGQWDGEGIYRSAEGWVYSGRFAEGQAETES
jgi:hypothetical protein